MLRFVFHNPGDGKSYTQLKCQVIDELRAAALACRGYRSISRLDATGREIGAVPMIAFGIRGVSAVIQGCL